MADFKSFVIGSSWLVFVHFFSGVQKIDPEIRNYSYEWYTLIAPLYLGLMNVLGGYLFGSLGPMRRYLWTGILSGILIGIVGRTYGTYDFTEERWNQYYGYILMKHFITFFVVIQSITQLVG